MPPKSQPNPDASDDAPADPSPPASTPEPGDGQVVATAHVKFYGLAVGMPTVVNDSDELRAAAQKGLVTID